MRKVMRVLYAELVKQHRNYFHSWFVYFSLLIWPVLIFFNAYYSYKSFNISSANLVYKISSEQALMVFLIIGFLGYNCFWAMVQSAWQMGIERQNGTLETIFLSPCNKLAMMYGRALGALMENIWMFLLFSLFMLISNKCVTVKTFLYLPLIFLVLILSSTIWGGLMNVIFLFSRDSYYLYMILDDPMVLFSGVRLPVSVFPYWAKLISMIFPLTYCLNIARNIFQPQPFISTVSETVKLLISLVVLVALTLYLLKLAEKNARNTGELNFY